ncbi:hypothetical protein F7734_10850 [Scytonema sp. UIC 10036]|uniref:hypothetical protein n=1 Tax=Scytonema sp. UIC 10036 TaxID=2304196 RepID=UPI0012DACCF2|nr:hypothetical protein [Scytonema sp. UIC 10036]MUG92913.1 hypothetical protein [Scytonema sp. UIC 10036]
MNTVNVSLKQQSSTEEFKNHLWEISQDTLDGNRMNELESLLTTEFTQGLPSDMEFNAY